MLKFFFFFIFLVLDFNRGFWNVMFKFILFYFFFFFFMMPKFFNSYLVKFFFLDMMSYGFIILTAWICYLMIMASEKLNFFNNYKSIFVFVIIFLMMFLYLTFSVNNLFYFYLFFESSLIPTLILILGWGYQPERIQAGLYLLFYTLLASLPLLLGIFYFMNESGTLNFFSFFEFDIFLFYFCMIMAFLVKMPMFMVHLWLPKAHVEAPISGSMILAGILLKLGGYGLIRIMKFIYFMNFIYNVWWISLSLYGGFLISLNCLRQIDMKMLIAYSSVSHMAMVLSGFMTLTYWGVNSSYYLMIAHGLCSSGLFCLANISYERLGTRSLLINKGLMNFMPSMSIFWFLLCSSNMSAPPSLNLLGEVGLINSLVSWSYLSMFLVFFLSFFSASYSLYLFSYSQHGSLYSSIFCYSSGVFREFLLLTLHWLPLNLLVLKVIILLI